RDTPELEDQASGGRGLSTIDVSADHCINTSQHTSEAHATNAAGGPAGPLRRRISTASRVAHASTTDDDGRRR
ncbi:MAG: hypothetical protein ABGY24_05520, partial [bacterium]